MYQRVQFGSEMWTINKIHKVIDRLSGLKGKIRKRDFISKEFAQKGADFKKSFL